MSTPLAYPVLNWPLNALRAVLGLPALVSGESRVARRIITDSRAVEPGDVFIALRGDRFDAHDFAADVIARGAVAVVAERTLDVDGPVWTVASTREALGLLSRAWRERFVLPVVAVTGSNGKTTTKEMVASILRAQFGAEAVLSTRGNLNNDVGVPHTLFELHAGHRVAVIEMGMNHPGEIAWLASLTQPTVALVNNAQREHQEFMKTVEAVAHENGAVFATLPADGVAVYPADDPHASVWDALAAGRKAIRFAAASGSGAMQRPADAHVAATVVGGCLQLQLLGPWGNDLHCTLQMPGAHNARNALAAAVCAWAAGCSREAIVAGLSAFQAVQGRMQVMSVANGGVLINDTYNANPDSVEAAIAALMSLPAPRCLVLGDMGEVGEQGEDFHRELGDRARLAGIDTLHTFGVLARHASAAFGPGATHHSDIQDLISAITALAAQQSGAILIKGSRFMKMERVVQALATPLAKGGQHAA